jgi:hypothetical protein
MLRHVQFAQLGRTLLHESGVSSVSAMRFASGNPKSKGSRVTCGLQKRKAVIVHQGRLERDRTILQPSTPLFPDGVPFTPIRKFQMFMGAKEGSTRNRKRYPHSIKRGR